MSDPGPFRPNDEWPTPADCARIVDEVVERYGVVLSEEARRRMMMAALNATDRPDAPEWLDRQAYLEHKERKRRVELLAQLLHSYRAEIEGPQDGEKRQRRNKNRLLSYEYPAWWPTEVVGPTGPEFECFTAMYLAQESGPQLGAVVNDLAVLHALELRCTSGRSPPAPSANRPIQAKTDAARFAYSVLQEAGTARSTSLSIIADMLLAVGVELGTHAEVKNRLKSQIRDR